MRVALAMLLLLGTTLAPAETIYKAPGSSGPVYSDQPLPGGRSIDLPPPNIAQPPPKPPAQPEADAPAQARTPTQSPAQPQAASYRNFRIVYPEDGGSAAANTAAFEIRVEADPPLQTEFGHAYTVSLDGKPVGRRYSFPELLIPPEFFGDTLEVNQMFRVEASIVDRAGKVLTTAKPIRFTMRFISNRRGYPMPRQVR